MHVRKHGGKWLLLLDASMGRLVKGGRDAQHILSVVKKINSFISLFVHNGGWVKFTQWVSVASDKALSKEYLFQHGTFR